MKGPTFWFSALLSPRVQKITQHSRPCSRQHEKSFFPLCLVCTPLFCPSQRRRWNICRKTWCPVKQIARVFGRSRQLSSFVHGFLGEIHTLWGKFTIVPTCNVSLLHHILETLKLFFQSLYLLISLKDIHSWFVCVKFNNMKDLLFLKNMIHQHPRIVCTCDERQCELDLHNH